MAGTKACAIVAVEILVKQNQVVPVGVVLELGRPSVNRSVPIGTAQKSARQPADNLFSHLE
jgi:hypothetical protein